MKGYSKVYGIPSWSRSGIEEYVYVHICIYFLFVSPKGRISRFEKKILKHLLKILYFQKGVRKVVNLASMAVQVLRRSMRSC